MKKVLLLASIGAVTLLSSCASTNKNANASRQATQVGKDVRGNWTLTNVDYRGFDNDKVRGNVKVNERVANVFDTANPDCYEGSTWSLVQNNKKGAYTFNSTGSNCPQGTADIIWDIRQEGSTSYFIFKDVTGIKAKQNTAGYKLKLDNVNANSMRLVQDVNANGKIAQVIYNFQR